VAREILLQILDVARFASTGGNMQGLSYLVISDKGKLAEISGATLSGLEEALAAGMEVAPHVGAIILRARLTGKDVILRNAPHLIVAMCDKDFMRGPENARFSLAYAELFAPTVGVGTCWAGFVQARAFDGYPPLLKALDLPENKKVAGALMAGYPRYEYRRLVDRNPLDIQWR
jgi:nitroreductase